MPPLLALIPAALLFLLAIMLIRTARFTRPPHTYPPLPLLECEAEIAAEHLAEALRFHTITLANLPPPEPEAFTAFRAWLEQRYPRVHASLERLHFGYYSQLYIWHGQNPELAPVLFSAHLDVVPADEGLASGWRYPPFEGIIADGAVWRRGALDMKGPLVAIFEAIEHLLREGYQPERTIYLALGEDEEIRGQRGAAQIASWLAEQAIHPLAVLDEGGAVTEGVVHGIKSPLALIGVAEKGFTVLHLKVIGEGGHAALPPRETAISSLARALTRLNDKPFPARLDHIRDLFGAAGSAASPTLQFLLANTWLFGSWLTHHLSQDPRTNALIRTTLTPTLIRGGVKENVLPPQAEAWLNARILPGESPFTVLEHVRRVVSDPNVQIEIVPGAAWAPSPISPTHTPAYKALHQVITSVYPHALVAPYLMVMASDARYYAQMCPQVYRFAPYALTPADLEGIHGVNEHLSIENLGRMIQFYALLMRVWGQSSLTLGGEQGNRLI